MRKPFVYDPEKRRQQYLKRKEHDLAIGKLWREKNKERHKELSRNFYYKDKEENPKKYLIKYAKTRATKKKIPFSITEADLIIPTNCPILGVPLVWNDPRYCPSIDRIIPKLGYIPTNIRIMSLVANKFKCDLTPDELRAFCVNTLCLLDGGLGL